MESNVLIDALETHSAGQPVRIVTSGLDHTLFADVDVGTKRDRFADDHDRIRRLVNAEPRGHDNLVTAWVVEPELSSANLGLFFTNNDGYLDMCGDATIAVVSTFLETGRLPQAETITLETPIGRVDVEVEFDDTSELVRVMIQGLESYVIGERKVSVEIDGDERDISATLAYGGETYALVDAGDLGLTIAEERHSDPDRFVEIGMAIREAINRQSITDPVTGEERTVAVTMISDDCGSGPDRNVIVYGDGALGRAPCGTGTCAKMAMLHADGDLGINEAYPHRSILGTEYVGRLQGTEVRNGTTVVFAAVGGRGHLTGRQTFVLSPEDDVVGYTL